MKLVMLASMFVTLSANATEWSTFVKDTEKTSAKFTSKLNTVVACDRFFEDVRVLQEKQSELPANRIKSSETYLAKHIFNNKKFEQCLSGQGLLTGAEPSQYANTTTDWTKFVQEVEKFFRTSAPKNADQCKEFFNGVKDLQEQQAQLPDNRKSSSDVYMNRFVFNAEKFRFCFRGDGKPLAQAPATPEDLCKEAGGYMHWPGSCLCKAPHEGFIRADLGVKCARGGGFYGQCKQSGGVRRHHACFCEATGIFMNPFVEVCSSSANSAPAVEEPAATR